ncbi:DUF3352 domain-containing protein [Flavilitoribacter nigricans]|uniref:WD40 repeat domain-containing protein n=1 Tax=Flavilitoribacter nigricans (strain ATCC 23147 / DSM 23189 / NBRC 102662 / NCIMB 1420 / SS-2) TaxID=1122177 RepID=A0A2D0NIE5_FLAN2|nr:DUF3352 domain-containing protein [Flavilitoribacter nigricans]PHN07523.1 hypothetical protein CRP01_05325 [Flavilitoribacter nigricans DSM 23189 = NBRC 102662]
MQRKLIYTIGILGFLGLAVWALDRWSIFPILPAAATDIVPSEASVVVTLSGMESGLMLGDGAEENAWQRSISLLPGLDEDLRNINSLIDTLFPSRTAIDRADGLVSIVPVGNGRVAGTWIFDLRNMGGNLEPEEWLRAKRLRFQSSSFRGQLVYTIDLGDGDKVALSKFRNLLILAKLPFQVEAALATEGNTDHWIDELLPSENPDALCSVYLHPRNWKDLIDQLFTPAGRPVAYTWSDWLERCRIDVFPEQDGYRLEGNSLSDGEWLDNQVPPAALESDLWGMLPANTAGIRALNVGDPLTYFRLHHSGSVRRFQRFFLPWIQGPLLELTLRPFNAQMEERQLYFFGFTDQTSVREALNEWMEEVGVLQTEDYQGFQLTQVYENESLFPFSDESWDNPWWTIVGNYVVLATNQNSLESWVDQYVVGNALPLTETVRQITLSESGGQFAFFLDWKQWRTGWQYLVENGDWARTLPALGQLALRVKTEGRRGKISGLWRPGAELQEAGDLSWRQVLSNRVAAGPWLVREAAGKPQIAAQDATNRLYLLDEAGRIKWQQTLDGKILSPIKTLQVGNVPALTFNTANAIHLVDMDGKPISPFPLELRNPTALPQTVIDFSDDRNYNFFAVSTDGCVYGYELNGGAVPGWNPLCQLGEITQPLLHFQHDNKDYLALRNTNGTLRAFARDGSPRLLGDFPPGPAHSSLQYQLLAGRERIVSCTDSGVVEVLPLIGDPIQIRLPVGNNLGVRMIYEDFRGDDRKDYLLSSGNALALHTYNDRGLVRQFERSFPQKVDRIFKVDQPGKDASQIGLLLESSGKIYLLSPEGEVVNGFPLAGSTSFFIVDLFQAGEPHLIVGYQDEILAYRMAALQ